MSLVLLNELPNCKRILKPLIMSLVLLNELPNCERIKIQGASDGDTFLGGLKQTVYFDTGRLQGYPLCEIDFFIF